MMLTILTYALFTGLGYFAQTWWQLLIYRFVAALGIGGEWAVGSALLAETWPRRFRPWISAMLQTAGNLGVLLAVLVTFVLAEYPSRTVFLVGVLPAFLVLWIRRAVPESKEWQAARLQATHTRSGVGELFRGPIRRTTLLILIVCTLSLTAHWAFLFWYQQNLRNLPDLAHLEPAQKTRMLGWVVSTLTIVSIGGNFLAAALARRLGFRRAIVFMFLAYFLSLAATYSVPLGYSAIWVGCLVIGVCHGVFALFTMYLPPLFPTLLRTTGMGFCYNIGRIVAGLGTVAFGLSTTGGDYRLALLYAGFLFLPAAAVAWFLPEVSQQQAGFTT
jgi:MFS family permease